MIEFLTENVRRAYPLEREWPAALDHRWAQALVDACVYASAELEGARVSLISVSKSGSGSSAKTVFTVGIPDGATLNVEVAAGLGDTATVYASSSALKAFLTVRGRAVDDILTYGTISGGDVGIPFAMRCSGGAVRRVTNVTAQGTAACTTPRYDPNDTMDRTEISVGSGEHAVLRADDGVDLEVTGMAPLVGDVLRVSALAAPEAVELDEEPVDMMIRGDDCFTVETIPGAKAIYDEKGNLADIVAREAADGDGGVIKIGTACKPCCQCEDYKDAVDMLRPAETKAAALEGQLDEIKDAYEAALAAFDSAKEIAEATVNSLDNVRLAISTAGSSAAYTGSNAEGTRQRFTATLLIENLTMVEADVSDLNIPAPDDYVAIKTVQSGSLPLQPGAMLIVVTTFRTEKYVSRNVLDTPPAVNASCTVTLNKPDGTTSSGTKSI